MTTPVNYFFFILLGLIIYPNILLTQSTDTDFSPPNTTVSSQQQFHELQTNVVQLYNEGKYVEGKSAALKVVAFAKKHFSTTSKEYAYALYNLVIFLDREGNNERAIELFLKIKDIEEHTGTDVLERSITYNAIGYSYRTLGDYHNALAYINHSIKLRANTKDDILAAFLSDKALCLEHLDSLGIAKTTNKDCLDLISQLPNKRPDFIQQISLYCYQNLASIGLKENDSLDNIEAHLKKTEDIIRIAQPAQKCYYTYQLWGDLKIRQKEFTAAHEYYNKAQTELTKELENINKDVRLGQLYTQKAIAYRQEGRLKEAIDYHQMAINAISIVVQSSPSDSLHNYSQRFINKLYAIEILAAKAKTFVQIGDLETAYSIYQKATNLVPETRRSYKEKGSKYQLAKSTNLLYEEAIALAIQLYNQTQEVHYKETAFALSECNKAVLLLESMQQRVAQKTPNILPLPLLKKEQTLRYQINSLERRIFLIKSNTNTLQEASNLSLLEDSLFHYKQLYNNELEKELKAYPKYWSLCYNHQPLTISQIRQKILTTKDIGLVEFFVGQKNIYLFLITQNQFHIKIVPNTPHLQQSLTSIQKIISTPPKQIQTSLKEQYTQFQNNSYHIYQSLLEELLTPISSQIKRLVVIPDGMFYNIPIDVLLTQKTKLDYPSYSIQHNDYLLKKFALSYHYSCKLYNFNSTNTHQINFAGLAPSFSKFNKIQQLQHNIEEVKFSAQLFKCTPFFNKEANFKNLQSYASSAKIIHISTHAEKNLRFEKLNQIYLADTILTNYDIENINFQSALIVLNACHTGSGKILDGEGAMTLARSIIRAGSPSVLATSWSIDDNTAKQIILDFYKYIKQGYSKDHALQKAKQQYLLTNVETVYKTHPFYWASFQQYGHPSPIFSTPPPYLFILSILGLSLILLIGRYYQLKFKK